MSKVFKVDTGGTLLTSLLAYYKLEDVNDFFGSNTLTNVSSAAFVAGKVANAVSTDGSASYLKRDSAIVTGYPFSIAGWVWIDSTGADGEFFYIGNGGNNQDYFVVASTAATGVLNMTARTSSPAASSTITAGSGTSNGWQHFAAVFTSATSRQFYINGSSVGTDTTNINPATSFTRYAIGCLYRSSIGDFVKGKFDEIAIWGNALSSQEVTDLYNGGSGQTMVTQTAQTVAATATAVLSLSKAFLTVKNLALTATAALSLSKITTVVKSFALTATSVLSFTYSAFFKKTETFTATTTWTCPSGVTSVQAECWGGGGSGGGATGNPSGGGGAAGGAYAKKNVIAVTPTTGYTVTVGAVQTGTTGAGTQGNPSWFSTSGTVFAEGGAPGALASSNSSSAAGGTGSKASSIGDTTFKGGSGGTGSSGASAGGGGESAGASSDGNAGGVTTGGSGLADGGDGGAGGSTAGNGGPGSPGTAPGGGGGGGRAGNATDRAGGDGARGQVILTYYKPYVLTVFAVTATVVAALTAAKFFLKSLLVTATGSLSFTKVYTAIKSLVVTATSVLSLSKVKTVVKSFALTATGNITFTRLATFIRTIAVTGTASLTLATQYIAGLIQKTFALTATGAVSLARAATFFRTLAVTATVESSASSGPNSPGTMTTVAQGGATTDWTNPDNAKVSDNVYATNNLAGAVSYQLLASNFGFSIPSDATIKGILVEVEAKTATLSAVTYGVHVFKGGVAAGNQSVGSMNTTEQYLQAGGSTSLWNTTWTPANINDSSFGASFQIVDLYTDTISVDHIRVTVYYSVLLSKVMAAVRSLTQGATAVLVFAKTIETAIVATATAVVSLTRQLTAKIAMSVTATVNVLLAKGRLSLITFATAATASVSLAASRFYLRTLSASATVVATVTRVVVRSVGLAVTATVRVKIFINGLLSLFSSKFAVKPGSYSAKFPANPGSYSEKYPSKEATYTDKYPD